VEEAERPRRFQPERRIATILFADLVGFTSLVEEMDFEDAATIQRALFETMRETVEQHSGQLEKFAGDAVMAVFGLGQARDDDADRAVRAGLCMVAAMPDVARRLGLETGSLQLRVGINTGEVVVYGAGPEGPAVTGDVVNVAARLETAAPPGRVLVGL
jgi:class 3 adenylate cyclase